MKNKKPNFKPSTLLKKSLELLTSGKSWAKGDFYIQPEESDETGKKFPKGAYCSLGAIQKIDTPNEKKATAYLAFAISIDRENFGYLQGKGYIESTITDANDKPKTKFSDIKRWFTKAIKLAKANGD